ncbi:MAG: cupin domain-containing protein [Candidatus Acidiferrales bacterium]
MKIRCVVTGQTATGKSVIVRDAREEPVTLESLPGFEFHRLWGGDETPTLPCDGAPPPSRRYFPAEGGFRFAFFTVPPGGQRTTESVDPAAAFAEMQKKLPGLVESLEPENPGMHTTDTVDFDVVVSGEICMELDDEAEVLLKSGDCVIQNGTRHAWRNRSNENCVIAVTLVGAKRSK